MKAAVAGLREPAGSHRIREPLKRVLAVCELRRQACEMKAALVSGVPLELPRRGRERAIADPDEPFYGKRPELSRYPCPGPAHEGTTPLVFSCAAERR